MTKIFIATHIGPPEGT